MAFPSTDPTRVAVSCNVRMHIHTLVCRVMCEKFVYLCHVSIGRVRIWL